MNEEESVQVYYDSVRKVLIDDWDPIGVSHIPEAKDEYDAYALELSSMLLAGKSRKDILDYLWWLETEHMGLQGNRDKAEEVADALVQISKERSK
jgi:hypothetical protein